MAGFPDNITEREFANMFLFAKGFEASMLKYPTPAMPMRTDDVDGRKPMDRRGGWPGGAFHEAGREAMGTAHEAAPSAKNKQIIGFAKFTTREEALQARDVLNGFRVDPDRGCILKAELAKKNLHTKRTQQFSSARGALSGGYPKMPMGPASAPVYRDPAVSGLNSTTMFMDVPSLSRSSASLSDAGVPRWDSLPQTAPQHVYSGSHSASPTSTYHDAPPTPSWALPLDRDSSLPSMDMGGAKEWSRHAPGASLTPNGIAAQMQHLSLQSGAHREAFDAPGASSMSTRGAPAVLSSSPSQLFMMDGSTPPPPKLVAAAPPPVSGETRKDESEERPASQCPPGTDDGASHAAGSQGPDAPTLSLDEAVDLEQQ